MIAFTNPISDSQLGMETKICHCHGWQLAFSLDVGHSKVAQNVVACLETTDLGFGVFWLIDQQNRP